MPATQVFVVGRVLKALASGVVAWELLGVYNNQTPAINACKKSNDFYAPVLTDELLVHEISPVEGGIFPVAGP